MPPTRKASDARQALLLKIPPQPVQPMKVRLPRYPVWTRNKALVISRYLRYFQFITHHGTYIDAFAAPQSDKQLETWAARLVLELQPLWLRHFHLFDLPARCTYLESLKARHPKTNIEVYRGDFNEELGALLASGAIREKEATFCLLDQRSFECRWSSVASLASHKKTGNKIELFYFLATGWLPRAIAGQKDKGVIDAWWGSKDWRPWSKLGRHERVQAFTERFRNELGYRHAHPWGIYERAGGGRVMYYMVHATDHDEAPRLMSRAYERAVGPIETEQQLRLDLGI
jgi:three-Cys-motif partner protein